MRIAKHGQEVDIQDTALANTLIKFRGWLRVEDGTVPPAPRLAEQCDHGHDYPVDELSLACVDDEGPGA